MFRFIIRRIIIIVPMLFIVVTLTWMLVRLAPGIFTAAKRNWRRQSKTTSAKNTG